MARASKIIALDLSKASTGWAVYDGGEKPHVGHWKLGSNQSRDGVSTPPGYVFGKLHERLADLRSTFGFTGIYYEEPINPNNLDRTTNITSLFLAAGLAAHVESFAAATGCQVCAVNIERWRKDFVGRELVLDAKAKARMLRNAGNSKVSATKDLKALTIARCRQLGFSPRCDDEADAIGILDYALDFHEHVTPPWRANEVLRPALGGAA